MLSKHSVSEGYGQEHDQEMRGKGRMTVDGGKGRTRTVRDGGLTYLYTGEWHRTRCIGFKRGLVYISQEADSYFPIGVSSL